VFPVLIAAVTGPLFAQPAPGPAPAPPDKSPWTIDDILLAENAGAFDISPDGKWVVWVKSQMDKEKDGSVSNLVLTNLGTKKEIQLTRGQDSHGQPLWSPDGEWIAFASSRPLPKKDEDLADRQLWLIGAHGGEPYPVTGLKRAVQGYQWVDASTIVFSAQEDPSLYEQELKKKKDGSRVVDDVEHEPPVRLFRLAIKDKKVTRLTDNTDFIEAFDVSPDGKRAATVHQQYLSFRWDHRTLPKTFVHDLATGVRTEVFAGARIPPHDVKWALDNSGFYAVAPYSSDPKYFTASIEVAYFYDLASGRHARVDLGWENGLASGLSMTNDGFVALLANGAWNKPARFVREGGAWRRTDIEGEHARNVHRLAVSRDGRTLVYEYSTASVPHQVFRATLDGGHLVDTAQLTDLNPGFKARTPAKTEVIRWKGAQDEDVEGILFYPQRHEAGKRYPLVTMPHGGPAGADLDQWGEGWDYATQLITQRGAFVLKPNYHGSSNYGLKWVESICCGKYYDLEVPDIERGVDHLVAKGLADPDRVATMGWSNGSILSIALSLANPDRYKAVSAGAGDVEWFSDWGHVDFGQSFDAYYFGKSPLEDPQLYLRKSPLFQMDKLKAPTIIFFGTEDRNVPTSQGWTHYRALYHLGKTVKFVLFPGEPHGPRKLTHQRRKLEEEMAWMDRYFFAPNVPAANEAFKKESPLGEALRRASAGRVGTRYGVALPGAARSAIVPEVVKRGAIEIGRFEVTRAQYASFDPKYRIEPGTENFPASGITFDRAKAYAAWLSQATGQAWRLPTEAEMTPLVEGRSGENTLDYWAGYAVNPDDAGRLAGKIKELGAGAPLLKEVGSFAGAAKEDEPPVYDLGGNVAEWAVSKDGQGVLVGGSADRPADVRAARAEADAAYRGLRVVRVFVPTP
jgi:dipeptidyl aminopeptidase/acylaminoacyl peptidase